MAVGRGRQGENRTPAHFSELRGRYGWRAGRLRPPPPPSVRAAGQSARPVGVLTAFGPPPDAAALGNGWFKAEGSEVCALPPPPAAANRTAAARLTAVARRVMVVSSGVASVAHARG